MAFQGRAFQQRSFPRKVFQREALLERIAFETPRSETLLYSEYLAVVVSVSQIVTSFTLTRPEVEVFSVELVSS